jgi:glucose/arabinose dehydrogenase
MFLSFSDKHNIKRAGRLSLVMLLMLTFSVGLPTWTNPVVVNAAPGTLSRVKVEVPADMRTGLLAQDRYLNVPSGYAISVYARVSKARFLAVTPDGHLLVSQPSTGNIVLVRNVPGGSPAVSNLVSGLRSPHDMVFYAENGTTYLYIAETNQINRYVYNAGQLTGRQVIITGLPDASNPELRGAYGHPLKNIAVDGRTKKLYVSIASTCNACVEDTISNPKRGSIYQYNLDGSGGRLYAEGIRNAEGLAFVPGTSDLWVVINNRDNIRVPDPNSPNYGKIVPEYVDNHPPEPFTRVRDGGNYGWPFCNPNPDGGMDNMPYDRDVELNADGRRLDCNSLDRINKGIQAHSAPLGLTFLQDTNFAAEFRNGAVTALHGSWNRTRRTGYKLVYFPWNSQTQTPGAEADFVTGWVDDNTQNYWGRPVDMVVDASGAMFISDDNSGTIYKLTAPASSPEQPGTNSFAHPAFERLWQRTDRQVQDGTVKRSFLWGPAPFTKGIEEEYAESTGGKRLVQYSDKSRMEITNPNGDQTNPFFVTNGLLARELISGQLQTGNQRFENRQPAQIGVAGDPNDTNGPTYQSFGNLTGAQPNRSGQPVTATLNRAGTVGQDNRFATYNVRTVNFVETTGHNIASPFWDFLNQTGPILTGNQSVQARLFEPTFYATGLPITEPYWTRVKVAGVEKDVLVQAFERRVLTYTPANPAGFQVEMGNVGRHYHLWRYGS